MVPPSSHRVSRVRRYSGYTCCDSVFAYESLTLCGRPSHALRLNDSIPSAVQTPEILLPPVWPTPRSLATTSGISVDVFSSPYLDVSVRAVPLIRLLIQRMIHGHYSVWVSPFGNPRIDAYLPLPVAYRSLSRPSSAPSAKAFPLCSYSLDFFAYKNYAGNFLFPPGKIVFTLLINLEKPFVTGSLSRAVPSLLPLFYFHSLYSVFKVQASTIFAADICVLLLKPIYQLQNLYPPTANC